MSENMTRKKFREEVFNRDSHTCVVPWCNADAVDAHHIIERSEWENGGYFPKNGASVCELHHKAAENNYIPPQAFWRWCGSNGFWDRYDSMMHYDGQKTSVVDNSYAPMETSEENYSDFAGLEGEVPEGLSRDINKWGDKLEVPHWQKDEEISEVVDYIKYPKTYHLPFSREIYDGDRKDFDSVDPFVQKPLVITIKMDGANAMLTSDRIAARNGKNAHNKETFEYLKSEYNERNLNYYIPDNIQIFGENMFAKHSIHYGCDGNCSHNCPPEDHGPELDSVFYIFGVYDTDYNIWLSWDEVEKWAEFIDFPTVPVVEKNIEFERKDQVYELDEIGQELVEQGHEGFIVRSRYPFHYGQFQENLGKYVRKNHVKTDEHWKHKEKVENVINNSQN